tara:strand:- start:8073 stop:8459 length:387 start_codon:yes stop_codon:yes gene_type:complete
MSIKSKTMEEITSDSVIISTHILNIEIISATILFLLLSYNKHVIDRMNKEIVTAISLSFCLASIIAAIYVIIAAYKHRIIALEHKSHHVSMDEYITINIPIIMSFVITIIAILLTVFVIRSTLKHRVK